MFFHIGLFRLVDISFSDSGLFQHEPLKTSIRAFHKFGQYFLDGHAIAQSYTQNHGGDHGRKAVDGVATNLG